MTERAQLIEKRKEFTRALEGQSDPKKLMELFYLIRECNLCLNEMG